jgi:hypothetical protein
MSQHQFFDQQNASFLTSSRNVKQLRTSVSSGSQKERERKRLEMELLLERVMEYEERIQRQENQKLQSAAKVKDTSSCPTQDEVYERLRFLDI